MSTIIMRELKYNFKSLLVWSGVTAALTILMLVLYNSMGDVINEMMSVVDKMPEGLVKAFGMDKASMATPLGFYIVKGFLTTAFIAAIYGGSIGANIILKEHNEGTIEFLLSKPTSRAKIFNAKFAVVLVNSLIFSVINAIIVIVSLSIMSDDALDKILMFNLCLAPLLLSMCFGCFGLLSSSILKKARTAFSAALALICVDYFISVVSALADKFKYLENFSFFKYTDGASMLLNGHMKMQSVLIMLVFCCVCYVIGSNIYRRKDVSSK